jgi:predicted nucleic acid-binding protein
MVIDTNVLLDLFVFQDPAFEPMRQALTRGGLQPLASAQTLAELQDVIAREKFQLSGPQQRLILQRWRDCSTVIDDAEIQRAPWRCKDKADQIFLDLAYSFRPCVLLSKDLQILKFRKRAAKEGVVIDAQWHSQSPEAHDLKNDPRCE